MKLDKRAIDRLLSLNDAQLLEVIRRLSQEQGLDLSAFSMTPDNAASIRAALALATSEDLARANEQLKQLQRQQPPRPRKDQ